MVKARHKAASALFPLMQPTLDHLIRAVKELDAWGKYKDTIGAAEGLLDQITFTMQVEPDYVPDEELGAMYKSGMSMLDVANHAHVSAGRVSAALKKLKIKTRQRGNFEMRDRYAALHGERLAEMIRMWGEGWTLDRIGTHYKITRERVRQLLSRSGVDTSNRPVSREERAIVREYVAGAPMNFLEEKYKISTTRLRNCILKEGEEIRPSPRKGGHSPRFLRNSEIAAEMYLAGKPVREIAERLGYGKGKESAAAGTIYRMLAVQGIKRNRAGKHYDNFN